MKKMQQGTEKSREHLLNKGLTIPVKYAISAVSEPPILRQR